MFDLFTSVYKGVGQGGKLPTESVLEKFTIQGTSVTPGRRWDSGTPFPHADN